MPYDPFAPPPQMMPPQAQPPLSPNNALGPVMMPGGGTTGAPLQPTGFPSIGSAVNYMPVSGRTYGPPSAMLRPHGGFDALGFQQDRNDWRAARPVRPRTPGQLPDPTELAAWKAAMLQWQAAAPEARGYTTGPNPLPAT